MRLGEEQPKVVHGHVYWSTGVCMVVEVPGCEWDRIYIDLFTAVPGDFLKHAIIM